MPTERYDLLVLGAGFAGSLVASIGRKLGLSVALLERDRHPRFAIGESSTPLANFMLADLADTYDLPWLTPLTKYGPWTRTYPDIMRGLKRGFSFFQHRAAQAFKPSDANDQALLVAANPDAERGDTHWLRQDVDAFMVKKAVDAGVRYVDRFQLSHIDNDHGWRITGTCDTGELTLRGNFLVDATGGAPAVARALGLAQRLETVRTSTRVIFSHFHNVRPWSEVLDELGENRAVHPFPCDDAALHHLIDGGWMWVLRFDDGIVSAGFSLDTDPFGREPIGTPEAEWATLISRYPSVHRQFERAVPARPMIRTGRIQRRLSAAAGDNWAILPHAACFVDPWLSSGIAHTLFGVKRLMRILAEEGPSTRRRERLAEYERSLFRESDVMDTITSTCFARMDCFPILAATTMLYFVAVTAGEERARDGPVDPGEEFLLAHDERYRKTVHELADAARTVNIDDAEAFAREVGRRLRPYNRAGLCDPTRQNMYPFPH